ncbi:MAG: [acyl-carrier-protein] S-malonyltransferase [Gammaproteobacteria bacterium]|nr:MAG: [acyl-carrier-protein] S-malonyltransferase [Gammaproteobacteria bacterium]RKZ42621.1 MAG: [acyl-carrier-protein] S-malonyltransferase [Gammaproteobacteria bacterium]RKZ76685.1 MAG: [acyl-carrier-protein] S-malonyltransferase [Gammaproteobacteria bacterium]
MKHAFVFPGQGSQSVGMLADLGATYLVVKHTFEEASEVLGYDLWKLSQQGPKEDLNQTDKTQPALLAGGVAVWRVWLEQGGHKPILMAGHSFGEYSALVCADALEFKTALNLVQDRGRFMQAAVPSGEGAMAAILGLKNEQIIELCATVAQDQVVSAVNFNAPGQVTIAGHTAAVKRAIEQAKAAKAKVILLPVSVPAHSRLMLHAAEKMAKRLAVVNINIPTIPVIHNVDVSIKTKVADIRTALTAQLYQPVRWVETIEKMLDIGVTMLFECGPGKVLTGMNKRIARGKIVKPIMDIKTLEQALEAQA